MSPWRRAVSAALAIVAVLLALELWIASDIRLPRVLGVLFVMIAWLLVREL